MTLPGDRRDDLLAETAQAIAAWFGTVIIYEDSDKRGRQPGEMQGLISAALRRARPGITCQLADGPEQALRTAVALADGAPTLFLFEKLATARDALAAVGAAPWPDAAPRPAPPAEAGAPPDVTMPDVTMPDLALPDLALPDVALPDVTMPDLARPDLAMPAGLLTGDAAAYFSDASADYETAGDAADSRALAAD